MVSASDIVFRSISNEYNSCFWLLSFILHNEGLAGLIREETEKAWKDSGELDVKYLANECPNLEAAFNETLRLMNAANAARSVTHEVEIGGKLLQPGSIVLIPFRLLHSNEKVWGETVDSFDHTRFLKKKSLARHPSFRPFGGGSTYCPGKVLAKQELFGIVAILMHQFNLDLAQLDGKMKQPFPRMNVNKPSVGFNGPVKGDDVFLDLSVRVA